MQATTLHDVHVAHGAKMIDFAGWRMPVQYGPILDEVQTVRQRTGLFDLGHMGRLSVVGPDAVALLDRLVTCHVAKIPNGAIRYGLACREDGNPLDDLLVYRTGPEDVFVVANASNKDTVLAWFLHHAKGARVKISDHTSELAMLALQGPNSEAALQPLVQGYDLKQLGYYKFAFATVAGMPNIRISRTGYTGEDGFELYFPDGESVRVWRLLLEAGAKQGLAPIGLGARDTLRLEAGMPLYGHEIDAEHNPVEAGLMFGISFKEEKGDWIGRAALMRVKEHPTRTLVGLVTDGKRAPREGYDLVQGDTVVGRVCSGAVSPTLGKNIGSGYLPVALAAALKASGGTIDMDLRGKRQACNVVDLPFYSRTRK